MIKKYQKLATYILSFILVIISLNFIDLSILPQKMSRDQIIGYTKKYHISRSSPKNLLGYKYLTKNKLEFTLKDELIGEREIMVHQTFLFKSITSIETKQQDYADKLVSGINDVNALLIVILTISSATGLLILTKSKQLSKNSFQNVVLINSFMTILTLLMLIFYN